MTKIPVMNKKQVDALWNEMGVLEGHSNSRHKARIKEIQRLLELNARRVIWNNRGIKIIKGGIQEAA